MIKNKKILITGGAGFLGSHLCKRLCKENEVIILDNLSTGRLQNIIDLIDNKKIQFIRHDVVDSIDLNNLDLILRAFYFYYHSLNNILNLHL